MNDYFINHSVSYPCYTLVASNLLLAFHITVLGSDFCLFKTVITMNEHE